MTRHGAAWWSARSTAGFALLVAGWALTRFLLVVVTQTSAYPAQENAFDVLVFERWALAFTGGEGRVPLRDGPWEYPAGAAPFIALPMLLGHAAYSAVFVQQMVLMDLGMLALLAFWGRRRGTLAGAWFWVAAVPLLGPVAVGRFDVVPTLLAAAGMVAAAGSAPLTAGLLLATGAAVKLWPALIGPIVLALHRGRLRVLAGGTAVGAAVVALVARFGGLDQLLSFLSYQQERGLEVEAVPALPLMMQRLSGRQDMPVFFAFGSYQVDGPGAQTLLRIADAGLVGVLALVAFLTWRLRRRAVDRGLAVAVLSVALMTGFLVFDKVLSPQYPLWIAGLVALALCWPASPLRPSVPPLCGVLLLTQLVYPIRFQDLLEGRALPVGLLLARDLLLVVVFVQATRAAWRLGDRSEDEVPVHEQDREQSEPAGRRRDDGVVDLPPLR